MHPGRGVADVDYDGEPLGAGLLAHQGADVVQHGGEGEVALLQRHLAGIDFGEIQNVVDDGEQMLGGVVDLLQSLLLGVIRRVALEQISEPQNGVHGGADLVAHVGQKRTLGTVGALRPLMGLGQLQGALVNHLLQVIAVLIQLLAELLLLGNVGLYRHVVGHDPILLADGGDGGQHMIVGAVLALVDELAVPALTALDGVPQGDIGGPGGEAGAQQGRGLADHFALLVAAGGQEGDVDILDAGLGIGDEDAVRTLLQRERQLAQLLLGQFALCDVQMDAEQAQRALLGIPIDAALAAEPAHLAIGQQDPELEFDRLAAGGEVCQQLVDAWLVVRVQAALPGVDLAELLGAAAIEAGALGGEVEATTLDVPLPDPDVRPLLGQQQPLFTLAQGAAGGLGADAGADGVIHQIERRQPGAALGIEGHLLVVQQLLLCQFALRDVLYRAVKLDYGPLAVSKRRPPGDDPGGVAMFVIHLGIALVGLTILQAAFDRLGNGSPPLLGEILLHFGIDGGGQGGIAAIDAVDLRRPEVAVIGDVPAPVADLGQVLGFTQDPLVAAQGLLRLLALLVVLDHRDEVVGLPLEVFDQCHRQGDPEDLASLAQVALLQGVLLAFAGQHLGHIGLVDEEIVRVGDLLKGHSHQLVGLIAHHVAQPLVDSKPLAVGGDQGNADRSLFEGGLEAGFTLLQTGLDAGQLLPTLGLPAAGVVHCGAQQADEDAVDLQNAPLHQILAGADAQRVNREQHEVGREQAAHQGADQTGQQAAQQGTDDDGQHEQHQQGALAKSDGQLDPDLQHQDGQQQCQQADAPALFGGAKMP